MGIPVPTSGMRSEMSECPTSTTSLWWLPYTFLLLNVLSHPLASHGKAKMHAWASSKQRHLRSHILRMRQVATYKHRELLAGLSPEMTAYFAEFGTQRRLMSEQLHEKRGRSFDRPLQFVRRRRLLLA